MKKPTVVSLFSGCGGLDLGFHEMGFQTIYAADNDPHAINVFRRNITYDAYIRDVCSQEFHKEIDAIGSADVLLGGFPCQGFSKAGPKKKSDGRNLLYLEMMSAIDKLQPSIFVAENVDGLRQNFGGTYLDAIVRDFSSAGYRVEWKIIDAVAFGVPQHRRRIIFIGVRNDQKDFIWPEPTHSSPKRAGEFSIDAPVSSLCEDSPRLELQPARTIRDALSGMTCLGSMPDHFVTNKWPKKYFEIFQSIGPGQKLCNVRHSSTSVYTWDIPKVFGEVTSNQRLILEAISTNRRHKKYGNIPNGNPLSIEVVASLLGVNFLPREDFDELLNIGYLKEVDGKYDLKGAMFCSGLFKRPSYDAPSPTVLTNFHNPRYFLHPVEDRPFSLRECARLQGFPDNFIICGEDGFVSLEDGYRLVGNAVPPPLSRAIASSVLMHFC